MCFFPYHRFDSNVANKVNNIPTMFPMRVVRGCGVGGAGGHRGALNPHHCTLFSETSVHAAMFNAHMI